jgi:hypothetical protein
MVAGIQYVMNSAGGILHALRPITLEEPGADGAETAQPAPLERAS